MIPKIPAAVRGGRHPLVKAAVLQRLIARNAVMPRPDFELHTAEVFNPDFHTASSRLFRVYR